MPYTDQTGLADNPALLRVLPFTRFEYVDVTFQKKGTDTVIPYTILKPASVEDIRWIETKPSTIVRSGADVPVFVYRSNLSTAQSWGPGYIVLQASEDNYSTRLLLFVERV